MNQLFRPKSLLDVPEAHIFFLLLACFSSGVIAQTHFEAQYRSGHSTEFSSPIDSMGWAVVPAYGSASKTDSKIKDLVSDPDPMVRSSAAYALGRNASAASIPTLHMMLLEDPNIKVRMSAAKALGESAIPQAELSLVKAVEPQVPTPVRFEAYRALGYFNTDSALNAIFTSLNDSDMRIRAAGLEALGKRADGKAYPAIVKFMTDKDPIIQSQAIWSLGETMDPRAVPAISEKLETSSNIGVRRESAIALGRIAHASAIRPLVFAASNKNEDVGVRVVALKSVTRLVNEAGVPNELLTLAKDNHTAVRAAAIHAIGMVRAKSSSAVLGGALKDAEPSVRLSAVNAMGLSPGDYSGPLTDISRDKSQFAELRINSLTALSALPTSELEKKGINEKLATLLSVDEPIDIQLAIVNLFSAQNTQFTQAQMKKFRAQKNLAPEVRAVLDREG